MRPKTQPVMVRLPVQTVHRLDFRGKTLNKSRSTIIQIAVEYYLAAIGV